MYHVMQNLTGNGWNQKAIFAGYSVLIGHFFSTSMKPVIMYFFKAWFLTKDKEYYVIFSSSQIVQPLCVYNLKSRSRS
jgi:hypothetical protein